QRLEGSGMLPRVPQALRVEPGLVLGRALEAEAVEERPAIEPGGRLVRPALDRLLELADVAGDEPEVELKGAAALEDLVAPHRAADRVERLIEGMAGGVSADGRRGVAA